ncbi:MAG: lamin tail domain-containing protein, partial [Planctomycetales bacterium]|nr:lamin tail domain-containing protein [Planctomycetales bacterium]
MLLATYFITQVASGDVVINEIFYHAPDDLHDLEYIELFNSGKESADLTGWKITKAVKFTFPKGTQLGAGEYCVIAKDAKTLREFYGIDAIGEFKKSLGDSGDEVKLSDARGKKIESVEYKDKSPWPSSADAYSASLERICPSGPANGPSNWAPSALSDDYDQKPAGSPGRVNSVFADRTPPEVTSVAWQPRQPTPGSQVTVQVRVADPAAIEAVEITHTIVAPGAIGERHSTKATNSGNGVFTAVVPVGNEPNRLLRFHAIVKAKDGGVAYSPRQNDLRPGYSAYVGAAGNGDQVPVIQFFHVGKEQFETGNQYADEQSQAGRRGFGPPGFGFGPPPEIISPEERLRRDTESQLQSVSLAIAWADVTLNQKRSAEELQSLAKAFRSADEAITALRSGVQDSSSIKEFADSLPKKVDTLRGELQTTIEKILPNVGDKLSSVRLPDTTGRRRGMQLSDMLPRIVRIEDSWFRAAMNAGDDGEKLESLAKIHEEFLAKRGAIFQEGEQPDPRELFDAARELDQELRQAVTNLTNGEERESPQ